MNTLYKTTFFRNNIVDDNNVKMQNSKKRFSPQTRCTIRERLLCFNRKQIYKHLAELDRVSKNPRVTRRMWAFMRAFDAGTALPADALSSARAACVSHASS